MRARQVEESSGGERARPVYTVRNEKEEPIISDLLEESGVSFYIHTFDDDESARGFGVVMVAEPDLEAAQEVVEQYKKERPLTVEGPLLEFNEEEGNFMPLSLADKDDDEEDENENEDLDDDEDLGDDEDDFDDEDFDDEDVDDDEDLDEDEFYDEDEDEYYDENEDRE